MARVIEDVPFVKQELFWCGYACLSMVLQYWNYSLTQEKLFDHIFGECDDEEKYSVKAAIGIGSLALGATQLTNLKVRLYSMEVYEKLKEKIPDINPHKILQAYIAKGIPCIVRIPEHYNVAIGFDQRANKYWFNETDGYRVHRSFEDFDRLWQDRAPHLRYDSRYLILAIYPSNFFLGH